MPMVLSVKQVIAILARRIERENSELFVRMDSLAAA